MVELERITAPGSTMCFTWNYLDKLSHGLPFLLPKSVFAQYANPPLTQNTQNTQRSSLGPSNLETLGPIPRRRRRLLTKNPLLAPSLHTPTLPSPLRSTRGHHTPVRHSQNARRNRRVRTFGERGRGAAGKREERDRKACGEAY